MRPGFSRNTDCLICKIRWMLITFSHIRQKSSALTCFRCFSINKQSSFWSGRMLSILILIISQLTQSVLAFLPNLQKQSLQFVELHELIMRFWLRFMVWSVDSNWCCFAKLCMMCWLSFLLLKVLWYLAIVYPNPFQLCTRISASFSKPLVLSLIKPILTPFKALVIILRFSFPELIFGDSSQFC